MAKKMTAGAIAFLVGIGLAVLLGILKSIGAFEGGPVVNTILILAGLVIGFMNISQKETLPIMVSALVIGAGSGVLAVLPVVGGMLEAILSALALVALPAGIVVAVMTFYNKAR